MASGSPSAGKSINKTKAPAGSAAQNAPSPNGQYVSLEFQVFGKVQRVHFRKYTQIKAKSLGLRGWCRNTEKGTVIGIIQGLGTSVNAMKTWLRSTGSPKSKISRAEFKNEKRLDEMEFLGFEIVP